MTSRLVTIAILVALVAVATWRHRRPSAPLEVPPGHRVPSALVGDADATWIVFSTPYCATCGPIERELVDRFPDHEVRRADVEQFAHTASALGVRRAPTVVRVDRAGDVHLILAGADAVRDHLAVTAST